MKPKTAVAGRGIRVKVFKVYQDGRGPIAEIRIKCPSGAQSIGVCLSDLNTDRLFRILGKYGVPLITRDAQSHLAAHLQTQVQRLLEKGAPALLQPRHNLDVVAPLT